MPVTDTSVDYAVIETFPPREFRFFRHYYITSSFFAVFFIGLVFVAWVPFVIVVLSEGILDGPIVRAAAYTTAAFLFFTALAKIGKREFDKTLFIVSNEGIIRRDPFRTLSAAWHDIIGVRNRRIPGAKGSLEIRTPHARILLPSTISGFGQLCGAIQKGLERAGRGGLMDSGFLRTMTAMGTMSERWNARAKASVWPIIAATLGTLLLNVFVALCVWKTGPVSLIVWAGITLPLPLLVYSVADIRLNRSIERALLLDNGTDIKEDLAGELAFGFIVTAPFYGILGIIAKTIFLR